MLTRLKALNPQLRLLLLAVVCLGMAGGIFETPLPGLELLHMLH